jgi:hypothetical protein
MGPAFKYMRSIKLLSDRLPSTMTMAATIPRIDGGDSWNLTLEYIVKGEDHQRGEGFALWLSKKDIFRDILDFMSAPENNDHVLGFGVG